MRIILADPLDNQNAGIHVYTREMINSLCTLYPAHYSIIRESPAKVNTNCENEYKLKSFSIPGYKSFRYFFQIPLLIRKSKAKVVIEPAHFGPFNLPKRIKRVTIIHDLTPILFPKWHRWHSQMLQKIFLKRILKNASLVLTNSQNTLNDLRMVYPFTQEKSICIYPGIDPFYICKQKEIVFEKEPFFLVTGTIEPRKNLVILLKAFERYKRSTNSKFKLVITGGKGWKSEDFYHELKKHPFKDDIDLKGYVPKKELKKLYQTCSAFIYPSLYEGFGFPVAEAMACGAPCIVSNTSSLKEVGGEACLSFSPNDINLLTKHLISIENNNEKQKTLIQKGLVQSRKFKWTDFAIKFNKLITQMENSNP